MITLDLQDINMLEKLSLLFAGIVIWVIVHFIIKFTEREEK